LPGVRAGMVVYLTGLVMVTAGIELTLALVLASQGKVPSPASEFWPVYLVVNIGLFAAGGLLVPRGLLELRTEERARRDAPVPKDPPAV